jgi:hypothetical protein
MLRRVAVMAAPAALLLPAGQAVAAKKVHKPVVTRVAPMNASIGETLTVYGKYFRKGKARNSVVFKRDGAPAIFVKADVSTRRQIKVVLPAKLSKYLVLRDGAPAATKFRIRILADRFGYRFTGLAASPAIGPEKPPAPPAPVKAADDGDCDGDGIKNGVDTDDDNDLLADSLEATLKTDQCNRDTDGDGIEDGYEYKSAVDLNDDEYQDPNKVLPYPGKRPYPNPLYKDDANIDFDGDSLTLAEEYHLWVYTTKVRGQARTLSPLSYSDGEQYSISQRGADGRRTPALATAGYDRQQDFVAWASDPANGYSPVFVSNVSEWWYAPRPSYDIRDVNRDGSVSAVRDLDATDGDVYYRAELTYYDSDQDGWLDDAERDEDADGLTNFDESHGCMMDAAYWKSLYDKETPYPVVYSGTAIDDADTDGDGVRDGADDQDHDDVPNLWECSRQASSGRPYDPMDPAPDPANPDPQEGFVNPFNPCLPSIKSRTCNRNPSLSAPWAPFNSKDMLYYVWN